MRVSKKAAARLFLSRQGLDRRTALTARSLDRLAYGERVVFDYWAHAACLVSRADIPYWRRAMRDYKTQHTGWSDWLKKNPRVVKRVEDAIRERGPLSSKDFEGPRLKKPSAGWWDWKPEAHALQFLWMSGRIAVHSRTHFHKSYDIAERVLPPGGPAVDSAGFSRWHLRKSLRALGAASFGDLDRYLTFPHIPAPARRRLLKALVKDGEAVPVSLGDGEDWLALKEDVPALEEAARAPAPAGTTLLSPFDSLLWHRERVRRLFGFDYKIEVYTPGPKRVHGYYSLPILHEGRLIGRLDPKNHREARRLEVRAIHFEDSFVRGKDVDSGLAGTAATIRSLADFLGAGEIEIGEVFPKRLRLPAV